MNQPTVTMHPLPPDNRPPPPETATLFVVVYAVWWAERDQSLWYVLSSSRETRDDAEKEAEELRNRGHSVYAIVEITAKRQEPTPAAPGA